MLCNSYAPRPLKIAQRFSAGDTEIDRNKDRRVTSQEFADEIIGVSFVLYNLDPRSLNLNTEHGVMIDCPRLARRMIETVDRAIASAAWQLDLDGDRLVWVDRADGREVRHRGEPEASLWKRLKVTLLGLLPIESQL